MKDRKAVRHRSRRFLLITGIIEVVLAVGIIICIMILGYHGFASGEMGTMVGMFSVSVLLFLLPFAAARFSAVMGLRQDRSWAYVVTLVLSALILLTGLLALSASPLLALLLLLYAASTAWAAAVCLRSTG
ncbi:MAG: hypothetical protein ACP5IA_04855 [Sediminispirochaetaceae bacterium]